MSRTYYTEDHEWLTVEGDTAIVGITEHAAEALGEMVFVEIKEAGESFSQGDEIGVVESVKAASEIYAPIDCEIVEVNEAPTENPGVLNEAPTGDGWLCKVKVTDAAQLESLMDLDAYKAHTAD